MLEVPSSGLPSFGVFLCWKHTFSRAPRDLGEENHTWCIPLLFDVKNELDEDLCLCFHQFCWPQGRSAPL